MYTLFVRRSDADASLPKYCRTLSSQASAKRGFIGMTGWGGDTSDS